jgi:hypothetical protein
MAALVVVVVVVVVVVALVLGFRRGLLFCGGKRSSGERVLKGEVPRRKAIAAPPKVQVLLKTNHTS